MSRLIDGLTRRLGRWATGLRTLLRRFGLMAPAPVADPNNWKAGRFVDALHAVDYKLYVPSHAGRGARPLLLMLHGCTQDPEDFAAGTRMNRLAEEHGVLVLYPTQTRRENIAKCWNWFLPQNQRRERGEAALLAALTTFVAAERAADTRRIYVAGLSAGAAMAAILGATHSDLFAAVGVHSGLPFEAAKTLSSALAAMKNGASMPAGTPVRVMPPTIVFHGDADETVHPSNGDLVVGAALASRAEPGTPRETKERSPGGRTFQRRIWRAAPDGAAVEQWIVNGAGHAWAGGSSEGSYTDPDGPDASAEMLRFFLAQARAI